MLCADTGAGVTVDFSAPLGMVPVARAPLSQPHCVGAAMVSDLSRRVPWSRPAADKPCFLSPSGKGASTNTEHTPECEPVTGASVPTRILGTCFEAAVWVPCGEDVVVSESASNFLPPLGQETLLFL